MKRTILASLVCCAAGAALADTTNVTLYGLVDMGYSWRGDNYNAAVGNRQGVDSGQLAGTRLGFKGNEVISDRLRAQFLIEAGIAADTGGSNQGGLAWGRQSFVGLESVGVGTLTMGRQYTPVRNLYVVADPFAMGSVAQSNNIFTHVNGRASNAMVVNTPYFGDLLAVEAMVSTKLAGDEAVANAGDTRYTNIAPRLHFRNDTLRLGLSWAEWKVKNAGAKNDSWDVVGMALLPGATLSAAYGRYDNGANADGTARLINGEKASFDRWYLAATVPLGNYSVLASWAYSKDRNALGQKAQQFGLGGKYDFSKRTCLYAIVAHIDTDNLAGGYEVADATNAGGGYRSGMNLGLLHTF